MLADLKQQSFSQRIVDWYEQYGRKDLPWQQNLSPYSVWLSEIMLQQTQVATVIPYYLKFLKTFPTVNALANATQDDVLALWTGLGYYARARNLHKAARIICSEYQGEFPFTLDELVALPGIGRSTAAAILSFSMQQSHAILDGNVKRVLARHFEIFGWTGKADVLKRLWILSEQLTPNKETSKYNQAMMDIGATLCTRSKPKCSICPVLESCLANTNGTVTELPSPKIKQQRPLKKGFLVAVKNQDSMFLQQRPSSGIWGGLWCFPEFETEQDANDWIAENIKEKSTMLRQAVRHKFSHYDYDMTFLIVKGLVNNNVIQDSKDRWINSQNFDSFGLPTPIKNILSSQLNLK